MNCTNCGKGLNTGEVFCTGCGTQTQQQGQSFYNQYQQMQGQQQGNQHPDTMGNPQMNQFGHPQQFAQPGPTNVWSIVGFVAAIMAFVMPAFIGYVATFFAFDIPALVISIIALVLAGKKFNGRGRGLAIAGIIIASLAILGSIGIFMDPDNDYGIF
ncbi:MAG: hypothetical protein FWE16_02835 [Firmicutes bacterium]|nr:hypothetical protein [Bacillota bacterium]